MTGDWSKFSLGVVEVPGKRGRGKGVDSPHPCMKLSFNLP